MHYLKIKKYFFNFHSFQKSAYNFEYFETEDEPQRLFVSEIIDCKNLG